MVRLALLSDQHGSLPCIPECDLVVLAGDLCGGWRPVLSDDYAAEWLRTRFADWLNGGPPAVVIAGNHDTVIQSRGFPTLDRVAYLQDSDAVVCGLRFWGSPWIKEFDRLAFNATEGQLAEKYSRIPNDVDVLVSHGPMYGHCDFFHEHLGSRALLGAVQRVQPKLLVCGHIHEGRGASKLGITRVVNTATAFTVVDL